MLHFILPKVLVGGQWESAILGSWGHFLQCFSRHANLPNQQQSRDHIFENTTLVDAAFFKLTMWTKTDGHKQA
jgi:hypothetical protein